MFPFDYIDPVYFVAALFVGLLYTYITAQKPTIIVRYPTPENAGKITYRDEADACYTYKVTPTSCPVSSMIKQLPIQGGGHLPLTP
jgi:hypothetical protein